MAKMTSFFNAMGGGKTTVILQVCYNYEQNGQKVILMKPAIDTKADNKILSRLDLERKVDILLQQEESLIQKYFHEINSADAIIVDEAQFLTPTQVLELWIISKELDIPVITYGLKTNFKGEVFPGSKELFAKSDKVEELPVLPLCQCGNKSRFNARKINGEYTFTGPEVLIDGSQDEIEYQSLCGECYYKEMKKQNIGITKIIYQRKKVLKQEPEL